MSNNLEVSTDPTLLSVDLPSITASPSAETFLPAEASSTCLLLPNSPSPEFTHPLTPSTAAEGSDGPADNGNDGDTNSSGSSSGLNMVIPQVENNNHIAIGLKRRKKTRFGVEEKRVTKIGEITITCTDELPAFVYWNWPLIRKCAFSIFICFNLGVLAFVVGMIAKLPKKCNPIVPWHHGSVFYEIFPASFQDSNRDGIGDLRGIANRVNYLKNLGIGAVRLNSIYPAENFPDHYEERTSLFSIDPHLGDFNDFAALTNSLHDHNISLVLDLPLLPMVRHLNENSVGNETDNTDIVIRDNLVLNAIKFWIDRGVDGFYIKDLEHFHNDSFLERGVRAWKQALGSDRCLIVSSKVITKETLTLLQYVDLVDVRLHVEQGAAAVVRQIDDTMHGSYGFDSRVWIHWSIDCVDHQRLATSASSNASIALILLELTLPGTPNLFYGNEITLDAARDTKSEHNDTKHLHHLPMMEFKSPNAYGRKVIPWMPAAKSLNFQHFFMVKELIELRRSSPAMYLKEIINQDRSYQNLNLRSSQGDLIVVERHFPRRKNYGTFTYLGNVTLKVDLSSVFYSGDVIVGTAFDKNSTRDTKVYFSNFEVSSYETIIVKLDK